MPSSLWARDFYADDRTPFTPSPLQPEDQRWSTVSADDGYRMNREYTAEDTYSRSYANPNPGREYESRPDQSTDDLHGTLPTQPNEVLYARWSTQINGDDPYARYPDPTPQHAEPYDRWSTAPEPYGLRSLDHDEEEDPKAGVPEIAAAPDGGLEAWLVAAGGASIMLACLGFTNAVGVFQEYYMKNQLRGEPADKVAWIGSVATFMQFGMGAIGGPLFDRYGVWVVRPAAVTYPIAMVILSFCTEYWHFMLVQGFLMGGVGGCLQLPAIAAVSQFFDKKRAAALGLVVAGASIGGVIFPIGLSKMFNETDLGFGWSVRIMAFVIAPFMAFSATTVKPRLPSQETAFFLASAFRDPTYDLMITALFFLFLGMFTPLFYIPTMAVARDIDPTLASYLLAILNGASTFGRVIPGILADKYGKLNVFIVAAFSTALTISWMDMVDTKAAFIVYSIVFGFTSGAIISGASAAIGIVVQDPRIMGTYLGMGVALASFAVLVGPPVNGALLEEYGGFLQVSVFSSVVCFVGSCLLVAAKATTPQGALGKV